MNDPIRFFVAGLPKPAGSKRGFYIAKIKRVIITDACKGSRDWKTDVKHAAQEAYSGEPLDCAIRLVLKFFMPRPKGHFNSKGEVKNSAPSHPTVKPDVLKLARGVEDALTQIIWRDDCLIVTEILSKSYHPRPGVEIEIWQVRQAPGPSTPPDSLRAVEQEAPELDLTPASGIAKQSQ